MHVAKWWGFDPDHVAQWAMPDFEDREEYMFVQDAMAEPTAAENELQSYEQEWYGR